MRKVINVPAFAADSVLGIEGKVNLARRQRLRRPPLCKECGKYSADLPRRICAGCEAYREHTGHF